MILACVSEIDWAENPFFDNLSSKNFYSGFQELEVSSMRQDYRDLHGPRDQGPRTHQSTPKSFPRNTDKNEVERVSE